LLSCLNTDIVGIGGRLLNAAGSIIVSTAGATVNRQPSTVNRQPLLSPKQSNHQLPLSSHRFWKIQKSVQLEARIGVQLKSE